MNEFENKGGTTTGPGIEELSRQLQTLRVLTAVMLVLLIGFSIGADYFLSKQISLQRSGTEQLQRVVTGFPRAAAEDFLVRLKEYSKTHADFASVMAKHPGLLGVPPQTPTPAKK